MSRTSPRTEALAPETTEALVIHAQGQLSVDTVTLSPASPQEALIDIAYGGICGSDLHYWSHGAAGDSILREPLILGHEVSGIVRTSARDGSGPGVGTRVTVHPARPGPGDGSRYPQNRPNLSPGCTYLGSAAQFPHTRGAFARTIALSTDMLRPLPDTLPLRRAALAEPTSVAWHAVKRGGDPRGKRVLVVGSGPIGTLIIAVLARAGASEIIAVDIHDGPLNIARSVGATRTLLAPGAQSIAGIDADIVIESSGTHRGLASAVRGATRGGRIVMVGLLPSGEQPTLISIAISRELELVGSFRFNSEINEVIQALADGSLWVDPIITHEYTLLDAEEAFSIASQASLSSKVLLRFRMD
ncbi:L-idonate 5-dehydrogenase [Lysinibacter sp. HNR]|uniref:L-idonate 5-dehydrogenase n=1 Tax=Lysinibacter sp. HNR TaxID=3031408 RepID=UPI002435456E|nr:L-idonate 5-dehydrogenase [Lysinibacter sp. HNR]WGD36330.1 L-idonate 5-dehydrogenase [Lysinibacter sp. HNR]